MIQDEKGILVVVRIRPGANNSEEAKTVNYDGNILNLDRRNGKGTFEFSFGGVLGPGASQEICYDQFSDLIRNVINGINTCIMAYGQTGSGKTYTMLGKGWEEGAILIENKSSVVKTEESMPRTENGETFTALNEDNVKETTTTIKMQQVGSADSVDDRDKDDEGFGIIPRSVLDLFIYLDEISSGQESFDYSVHCQFMQIYNEKVSFLYFS